MFVLELSQLMRPRAHCRIQVAYQLRWVESERIMETSGIQEIICGDTRGGDRKGPFGGRAVFAKLSCVKRGAKVLQMEEAAGTHSG